MSITARKDTNRLTSREAAEYLHLSKARLDIWRSERKGPVYLKLGGRVFYQTSDLDAFIASSLVRPGSDK
jgi:predicted DNA-binding transcriptional regulator AlpA